jgi:hypothetical protein
MVHNIQGLLLVVGCFERNVFKEDADVKHQYSVVVPPVAADPIPRETVTRDKVDSDLESEKLKQVTT